MKHTKLAILRSMPFYEARQVHKEREQAKHAST